MKQCLLATLIVFVVSILVSSSPIKEGSLIGSILSMKNHTIVENNGEYPFIASLAYEGQHICGAAIIKPFFVLTAAHCFNDKDTKKWIVRAGSFRKNDNSNNKFLQVRQVAKYAVHYDYDRVNNPDPDIALIKLRDRFIFGLVVNNIQLPKPTIAKKFINKKLTVLGYGEQMDRVKSKYLRRGQVVVDSNKHLLCGRLSHIQMCTNGDDSNVGLLHGDSGGPLILEVPGKPYAALLVGVASIGLGKKSTGEALIHTPSIFVEVATVRQWIDHTITILQKNSH